MKKNLIKVLGVNFLIIYNLLIFILFAPSFAYFSFRFLLRNNISNAQFKIKEKYKKRQDLIGPLIEFEKLSYLYHDYIVWRRKKFNGDYININEEGIRQSLQPLNASKEEYLFLGGSTIFGYGVADNKTIPSIFGKLSGKSVVNLGDTGYTSRQSLALYINSLVENKINKSRQINIISYDGANDIRQKCRTEVNGLETEQQSKIREKLNTKYGSINYFMKPWFVIINILKSDKNSLKESFNCHQDPIKAEYVADTLISTWRTMYKLAESNNHDFTAILQPVIYLEGNKINNDLVDIYGKQFVTVYPIIKRKVKNEKFKFLDLTNTLKGARHTTYIDFCHIDSEGNQYIANEIKDYFSKIN